MRAGTLIYTIALMGYDRKWKHCIDSHRSYAQNHLDYHYVAVTESSGKVDVHLAVWLKISLMIKALEAGYSWVFWVDADCEIMKRAPRLQSMEQPEKSLYMALGHSGRVNAGVMLVKNTAETQAFYKKILKNAEIKVPSRDRVLFENGHIIQYSKDQPYLEVIDQRWNNSSDPDMDDFIRHYTGPMGDSHGRERILKMPHKSFISKVKNKLFRKKSGAFVASVEDLADEICKIYSQFRPDQN